MGAGWEDSKMTSCMKDPEIRAAVFISCKAPSGRIGRKEMMAVLYTEWSILCPCVSRWG